MRRLEPNRTQGCPSPGFDIPFQPLQVAAQVGRGLVAQIAILFEQLLDDLLQLGGQRRVQLRHRQGIMLQNAVEDDRRSRAIEGQPAGRHLIKDRAQRKQVGARIDFLATRLLRRHISDRAHGRSGRGQVRRSGRVLRGANRFHFHFAARQLGQPEVEDFHLPARRRRIFAGLMSR